MARFRGVGPPATGTAAGAAPGGGSLFDIAAFKDALSGITAPLQSFQSTIKDVAASFLLFKSVSLAAPGTMQRFNIALQDSTAVIGQRLAPVMETATGVVKLFGDFLQTVLPSADDFADVLAPINDFLGELRDMLTSIAPIIKDVLIVGLKALGEALKLVLWPFRVLFQFVQEVFGVPGAAKLGSAAGSAARDIRFEDPMSAVKSVYQAAFQARGGEKKEKTPLEKIDESVRAAVDWLKKIFGEDSVIGQVLRGIAGVVKNIYDAIPKELKEAVAQVFDPEEGWGAKIGNKIADIFIPGNKEQPPRDMDRAKLVNEYAKAFGQASRQAQAIGETAGNLPFSQVTVPLLLKEMLEELRDLGAKAGVKDVAGDINQILLDSQRRAMDGTH